jgi:uncharacterized RDD family membrane protein YckC
VAGFVTGEAVVVDLPVARFPSRLLALAIDLVVQAVLLAAGTIVVVSLAGAHRLDNASAAAFGLGWAVLVLVGYPTIFETTTRGRSLGKLALGLRVVGENGSPERFRQALLRALTAVVEIWILEGAPALICSLLSEKGKRLGDVFAGTFVIQERVPAPPAPAPVMPASLAGWAAGLEMSGLPEETAAMARQYLARFFELSPAARDEMGRRIAAAVAARVSPPPPPGTWPAAYLAAVLAERRAREQARLAARQPWSQPAGQWPPAAPPPAAPPPGPRQPPAGQPPAGQPSQWPAGQPSQWPAGQPRP